MRAVPLIVAIVLISKAAFGVIHVAAGRSNAAINLQNEGQALLEKGDYANARKNLDEAIRLDPTLWPAYHNRAVLNMREHKLKAALQDATMALRERGSFSQSAILRAEINSKLGNYDAVLRELKQVASLGSRGNAYPEALNGLAWFHATCPESRCRNGQLAVTEAKRACSRSNYQKPGFLDTLAAAYAEMRDFDNAVRFEEKAMAIGASPEDMKAMREHLASFKQHRPYRDTPER